MSASDRKPARWYEEHPHARFSFTRLSAWRRCPAWFRYAYLDWHRTWSTPVLKAGHVVQEALERTFDAAPAPDVDLDALASRAFRRMKTIFDESWERAKAEHEEDPNGFGPFDLPEERYEGYLRQGLLFHLGEVRARLENRRPRTGEPLPLPPIAGVAEAWAAVRPWHAPHDEGPQPFMESIPEGWFQGQFDLVYGWTGGRRIVDIKASGGRSVFSTEIELQLASYAWLDTERGRGRPEGIEAWFLGRPEPIAFPVPDEAALRELRTEVEELIERSGLERGFGSWREEDFAPEPERPTGFEADPGEPSAWCRVCPAAFNCPRSARRAPEPRDAIDFTRSPESGGSVAVSGLVLGVGEPLEKGGGKTTRRFTLSNSTGARSFTWEAAVVQGLIDEGLRAGRVVRLDSVRPWRHPSSGNVLFYPTAGTHAAILSKEWDGAPNDPPAEDV